MLAKRIERKMTRKNVNNSRTRRKLGIMGVKRNTLLNLLSISIIGPLILSCWHKVSEFNKRWW